MQVKNTSVLRFEMDEADITEREEMSLKAVEVEILPPIDINDKRKVEIYNGITEIDEKLSAISSRVDELNTEIDILTNHADGLDYAVSVISGIIAGIIDSLFVGETEIDKDKIQKLLVEKYHTANDSGFKHKNNDRNWISSPMYHRLDDLAHHPSIAGLVASVLVRYFRLVVYIDGSDGKPHIFLADTSSPDLTKLEKKEQMKAWIGAVIGGICIWLSNLTIQKYEKISGSDMPVPLKKVVKIIGASPLIVEIFKTVDTWVGHMMSDVSTPQGIPGIFLSLLKEISVLPVIRNTDFRVWVDDLYYKGNMNLSEWGGVVFTAAKKQSLPVLINEVIVRCFFLVRHLAEELRGKKDFEDVNWNKVLPFRNRTIVRMLTISTGTFMAFDIADAAIRSGGFNAACILRINFVGVGRFAVAIGTDIGMGIKKKKAEKEKMLLCAERLSLLNAKIFYKQGEMWISAEKTEEAIGQVLKLMEKACIYYSESIADMDENFEKIDSHKNGINENNPKLISDILDEL